MSSEETTRAPLPKIKLDRMRDFGSVFPPETMLCSGGQSIPASLREENPSEYQLFHNRAIAERKQVVHKVRCYEQDGFSFDAEGLIIEETLDEASYERAKRAEAEKMARVAAKRAHAEAMRAAGYGDTRKLIDDDLAEEGRLVTPSDIGNPDAVGGSDKVDLLAWARGEGPDIRFFAVKKAFRDQHNKDIRDRADALDFLVSNGLISAAAVSAA